MNKHIKISELNQYINLRTANHNKNNNNFGVIKLKAIDTFVSKCLEKYQTINLDKKDAKSSKNK